MIANDEKKHLHSVADMASSVFPAPTTWRIQIGSRWQRRATEGSGE
jgi:hypothetical protein